MEHEVIQLLRSVGQGDVTPVRVDPPSAIELGLVSFRVADWTLRVFFDVGAFDYVDRAVSPNGQVVDFGESPTGYPDSALQLESPGLYGAMVDAFENAANL